MCYSYHIFIRRWSQNLTRWCKRPLNKIALVPIFIFFLIVGNLLGIILIRSICIIHSYFELWWPDYAHNTLNWTQKTNQTVSPVSHCAIRHRHRPLPMCELFLFLFWFFSSKFQRMCEWLWGCDYGD